MDKVITNLIIAALRELWRNKGGNRKTVKQRASVEWIDGRKKVGRKCEKCGILMRDKDEKGKCPYDYHHVEECRAPPWQIDSPDWNLFINRLFYGDVLLLCKECHRKIHAEGK
jgi:hypothetical protein